MNNPALPRIPHTTVYEEITTFWEPLGQMIA